MPGTNRLMSDEATVNIGALQQRVFGLESSQRAIGENVANLASRVESLFAGLSSKIEERSRPQYSLLISLGVLGLAVIAAVGGLAYAPIRENQSDLKLAVVEMTKQIGGLGEKFVSIRELDARSGRTREEMARLNLDLTNLGKDMVPRAELVERFRSFDAQDTNLQRQLDELKRFNTNLVPAPDFLKSLDDRMRALERRPP